MNKIALGASAVAFGLIIAGPALAHAKLKGATPGVGTKISTSPHQLVLEFSEGVVAKFSGIALRDPAGKPVATGLTVNGSDKTSLTVPIPGTLRSGTYRVEWHVVSVDTHRSQGSFSFTITP